MTQQYYSTLTSMIAALPGCLTTASAEFFEKNKHELVKSGYKYREDHPDGSITFYYELPLDDLLELGWDIADFVVECLEKRRSPNDIYKYTVTQLSGYISDLFYGESNRNKTVEDTFYHLHQLERIHILLENPETNIILRSRKLIYELNSADDLQEVDMLLADFKHFLKTELNIDSNELETNIRQRMEAKDRTRIEQLEAQFKNQTQDNIPEPDATPSTNNALQFDLNKKRPK